VAIAAIDLDRFTQINESLGQVAGDEALCTIGRRLAADLEGLHRELLDSGRAPSGHVPVLARLPGDEFAVLLPAVHGTWEVAALVGELVGRLGAPVTIAGTECFVSGCAGIALYPRDSDSAGLLLSRADSALADAKLRGSQSVRWYTPVSSVDGR